MSAQQRLKPTQQKCGKTPSTKRTIKAIQTGSKHHPACTKHHVENLHGIQEGSHATPNKQKTSDVWRNKNNNVVERANTVPFTYNSGADGHYVSKDDRKTACMPILRSSNKKVGVENGDTYNA